MLAVAAALEKARVAHVLVGSFSSSYHGIPRSTEDADFLLQVEDLPVSMIAAALGPDFKLDPQVKIETFTMGEYYTISHRDSDFAIDLFLLKNDPHDQATFQRKLSVTYQGLGVFISTAEDIIITKLRWSQGGRRTKDINDARGVIAVQTPYNLDLPYIRNWTDQHHTRELFEQLLTTTPHIE
jgi:hypothetical protein